MTCLTSGFLKKKTIILCGKVDWIRYNEEDDSVQLVDFKNWNAQKKKDWFISTPDLYAPYGPSSEKKDLSCLLLVSSD